MERTKASRAEKCGTERPVKDWSDIGNARSVHNFERLEQIGEGTYGRVYMAKDKQSGEIVALKKVRMSAEKEGFPITALREISILQQLDHPNIVELKEIAVDTKTSSVFLVFEYCEHDLAALLDHKRTPFLEAEVKCILIQLLHGVAHMHRKWYLHRDLKASNLLYNNKGEIKLADFGLARVFGHPLKPYTPRVVTLWYRAPELLLGCSKYGTALDMWSVGAIFGELLNHAPLLPGNNDMNQLEQIFKLLGTPTDKIWPGFSRLPKAKLLTFPNQPYNNLSHKFPHLSSDGLDLLDQLLTYDPSKRISAEDALKHRYFMQKPLAQDVKFMPTFPELRGEQYRRKRKDEPNPPSAERDLEREPSPAIKKSKKGDKFGSVF